MKIYAMWRMPHYHLAADVTDISCRAGLHLQFFLFVLMYLVTIDPVQQGDAQDQLAGKTT